MSLPAPSRPIFAPSLMRWGLAARLALVAVLCLVLWLTAWWGMTQP